MAYSKLHYRIPREWLPEFNIMASTTCLKSLTTNLIEGTYSTKRSTCNAKCWLGKYVFFFPPFNWFILNMNLKHALAYICFSNGMFRYWDLVWNTPGSTGTSGTFDVYVLNIFFWSVTFLISLSCPLFVITFERL